MGAAERDGELIADLAAERPLLGEADVVRVAGLAAADEAGLGGDKLEVGLVAVAASVADRQLRGRLRRGDMGAAGARARDCSTLRSLRAT